MFANGKSSRRAVAPEPMCDSDELVLLSNSYMFIVYILIIISRFLGQVG